MTRFTERTTETLRDALRDAGISQRAASAKVGRSPVYAHRRLSGAVPLSLDDLEALAAVAGLEVHVELVPAGGA